MFFPSIKSVINYNYFWSRNVSFGYSSYGTKLNFNDNIYFVTLTFVNGTQLYFKDILLNENIDDFKFTTELCNATITKLSDTELNFIVTGLGNQTIYLDNKTPISVLIDGAQAIENVDYTVSNGYIFLTTATNEAILLFDITPNDALTFGVLALIIAIVALALIVSKL